MFIIPVENPMVYVTGLRRTAYIQITNNIHSIFHIYTMLCFMVVMMTHYLTADTRRKYNVIITSRTTSTSFWCNNDLTIASWVRWEVITTIEIAPIYKHDTFGKRAAVWNGLVFSSSGWIITSRNMLFYVITHHGLLARYAKLRVRMRRECRERFPRHRGWAIPTCITARASRTCRDAFWDR